MKELIEKIIHKYLIKPNSENNILKVHYVVHGQKV